VRSCSANPAAAWLASVLVIPFLVVANACPPSLTLTTRLARANTPT